MAFFLNQNYCIFAAAKKQLVTHHIMFHQRTKSEN